MLPYLPPAVFLPPSLSTVPTIPTATLPSLGQVMEPLVESVDKDTLSRGTTNRMN